MLAAPVLAMPLVGAASAATASPSPPQGVTERVSVASDGAEQDGWIDYRNSISADGRYVAFSSDASNLVEGDTNDTNDLNVFVRDRETGVTERVSVASDGAEGDSKSSSPAMSADGRYVAFSSDASNLVPGDTNDRRDVFVRDRETGVTERVSVASDGTEGDSGSLIPSISADGRYVAFSSDAANLVPGDTNDRRDVFVRDRETGVTERVSVASDGTEGDSGLGSGSPAMSADGRHVAFSSDASNLVEGDTNDTNDLNVFVRDRPTGITERVSVASDGPEGDSGLGSGSPAMSADGRHVAFRSWASNLVPDDTNDWPDVFVRDRWPSGEPPAGVVYTGPLSGVRGEDVTLSARFVDRAGARVAGRVVRFAMEGFEAEARTDANGDARVQMPMKQSYGSHDLVVSFAGDQQFGPQQFHVPLAVLWEHEFADGDDGDRVVRVNTLTSELQFAAPGAVSEVKTDPGMRVGADPLTGREMVVIGYTDDDLTVVGRFYLDGTGRFAATVRTPSNVYVLRRGI